MIGIGELSLDRIVIIDKFKVFVCICLYIKFFVRCMDIYR